MKLTLLLLTQTTSVVIFINELFYKPCMKKVTNIIALMEKMMTTFHQRGEIYFQIRGSDTEGQHYKEKH